MTIYDDQDELDEELVYDEGEGAEFGMPSFDPVEDPDVLAVELDGYDEDVPDEDAEGDRDERR